MTIPAPTAPLPKRRIPAAPDLLRSNPRVYPALLTIPAHATQRDGGQATAMQGPRGARPLTQGRPPKGQTACGRAPPLTALAPRAALSLRVSPGRRALLQACHSPRAPATADHQARPGACPVLVGGSRARASRRRISEPTGRWSWGASGSGRFARLACLILVAGEEGHRGAASLRAWGCRPGSLVLPEAARTCVLPRMPSAREADARAAEAQPAQLLLAQQPELLEILISGVSTQATFAHDISKG